MGETRGFSPLVPSSVTFSILKRIVMGETFSARGEAYVI